MKRVLFVSDNFTQGGLETRINSQVRYYREQGIKSYLACANFLLVETHEFKKADLEIPGAVGYDDLLKTAGEIEKFCREKRIDAIDCHPLYCFVPTAIAASRLGIPMSYTIHGAYSLPQEGDAWRELFKYLLRFCSPIVVGEYLLEKYAEFLPEGARVVENGLEVGAEKNKSTGEPGYFAYASRLSEEKTRLLIEALPRLAECGLERLDVWGEGEGLEALVKAAGEYAGRLEVKMCGWTAELGRELASKPYAGFIGMGRSAIEAMFAEIPTLILGYGGLAGIVTEKNFKKFKQTNFTSWEHYDEVLDLAGMAARKKEYIISGKSLAALDAKKIWVRYLKSAPEKAVDPGVALVCDFWLEQLEKVRDEKAALEKELRDMQTSASWKVTKPLRYVNKFLK